MQHLSFRAKADRGDSVVICGDGEIESAVDDSVMDVHESQRCRVNMS